jgi:hypothetical protein
MRQNDRFSTATTASTATFATAVFAEIAAGFAFNSVLGTQHFFISNLGGGSPRTIFATSLAEPSVEKSPLLPMSPKFLPRLPTLNRHLTLLSHIRKT